MHVDNFRHRKFLKNYTSCLDLYHLPSLTFPATDGTVGQSHSDLILVGDQPSHTCSRRGRHRERGENFIGAVGLGKARPMSDRGTDVRAMTSEYVWDTDWQGWEQGSNFG